MKQYNEIKGKYPGALLLFRVGDFYETFGQDAVDASKILDITLTKRSNGSASEVELAGFPHHSLDTYLPRLVRAGRRVAICDQLQDPKDAKGIVERGVTEMVTPGVSLNDQILQGRRNNYLASVFFGKFATGVAFLDVSTGEFMVSQASVEQVQKLIQSFQPSEVVYSKTQQAKFEEYLEKDLPHFRLDEWIYQLQFGKEKILNHFGTAHLKGFGIEDMDVAIIAAGAILHYLDLTEHKDLKHIASISRIDGDEYVWLDRFTVQSLELLQPQSSEGTSLLEILDHCLSPMGSRLLQHWVALPLKSPSRIRRRQQVVRYFYSNAEDREVVQNVLHQIGDIERLAAKVSTGRVNPREMAQLNKSLCKIADLKKHLSTANEQQITHLIQGIHPCEELCKRIGQDLSDNPPIHLHQAGLIREGVNERLDELRELAFNGKDYLLKLQQRESERTGIQSLKISYNKVFGYYLEVRNVHKDKVPAEWIRKQTLVNAERYITEELKEYEEKILTAEQELGQLEQEIYRELVIIAQDYVADIQRTSQAIAQLDCLVSFAEVAINHHFTEPEITDSQSLLIKKGRHPVIEQKLALGESYVPNDVILNTQDQQIIIITGPNMAGKSALLRQTALIVLMAQMGSYVPADEAHIGWVDKVFSRVGASDNVSKGESTFMVEMTETASILNNMSSRSLILMDEIGRGTSTFDGISIAWAIVEFLHNQGVQQEVRPKTLFATHYHELNELTERLERVRNYNVAVKEVNGKVVFIRKLQEGGSQHSFGINVAQLAGMPNQVLIRAQEVLQKLESEKINDQVKDKLKKVSTPAAYQMNIFETVNPAFEDIKKQLKQIDINSISPIEALMKLNEIKALLGDN